MPEAKDETIAKASYIVTFFNELQQLTWTGSSYINMLAKMREKYPKVDMQIDKQTEEEGFEEQDQVELVTNVQYIRSYVFMSYVKFTALSKQIEQFKKYEANIKALYEKISTCPIPEKKDVESFVITMNELFVEGIVGELLGSAGDVLRSLTQ